MRRSKKYPLWRSRRRTRKQS